MHQPARDHPKIHRWITNSFKETHKQKVITLHAPISSFFGIPTRGISGLLLLSRACFSAILPRGYDDRHHSVRIN